MNMEMMKKLLALMLALVLCAGVLTAFAEETAALPEIEAVDETATGLAPETVMATVGGKEITAADVDEMYWTIIDYYMNYYGYDLSGEEMRGEVLSVALLTLVQEEVITVKGEELGLNTLTDEETAQITAEIETSWDEAVTYYAQNYFGVTEESTDEEKADARVNALALLESMGYTLDAMVESELEYAIRSKIEAIMMESAVVTDEDILAAFGERVTSDEEAYKDDIASYEISQYYGTETYYVPEGYRGVLQILLAVDDEKLTTYQELSATAETTESADAPTVNEQMTALYDEIMAEVQTTYAEIVEKFNAGTPFVDLIAEYNIDPGMTVAENLAKGYEVHKDSILYDAPFVAAAFSVDEIGQMSEPHLGSYGAYVVYYLRDLPAGAVELTEEIKAALSDSLLYTKQQEAYNATVDQWMAEVNVVYTEAGQPYVMADAQ